MAKREAFTLVEVMVATLIITLLIASVYKIKGDATHRLAYIKNTQKYLQYDTFLLGNAQKYGFENDTASFYDLVYEFNLERELRNKLKKKRVDLHYKKLDGMELPSGSVLEVGKTTLRLKEYEASLLRVRFE